jgi:hypothetical protein
MYGISDAGKLAGIWREKVPSKVAANGPLATPITIMLPRSG